MNITEIIFQKCILHLTQGLVDVIVFLWQLLMLVCFLLFLLAVNPNLDQVVFSL